MALSFTVVEREPAKKSVITLAAFYKRFTIDELVAIDLASIGDTESAARVRSVMMIVKARTVIDLALDDTAVIIDVLTQNGLLTHERAAEIFSVTVRSDEQD